MSTKSDSAHVEVIAGQEVRAFQLDPGSVCQIGRDEQSTIVLADRQVSRRHAMIQSGPSGLYLLTDLGSRNGTWLNQRRVSSPVALKEGDRIQIGECAIVFHGPQAAEAEQPVTLGETVLDFAQRVITVLVIDIRDFTGLARRLPEARLSEVISAFMRDCGTVLAERGAWTQKYIGDAVMAVWLHPNDAPGVGDMIPVLSALEKIFGIAAGLQAAFALDAPVRVGAGINTGLACVGNMGSEASADYTAVSDTVNLAFRLESATKEVGCDIALGKSTHEILATRDGVLSLFQEHVVSLKGYREPKPLFATGRPSLPQLLETLRGQQAAGCSGPQDPALDTQVRP